MLVRQRPVISIACSAATSGHSFSTAAAEGLYEVLGLDRSASLEDIKSAFRKKAKAHHPDVKGSTSTSFAGILRAYQVLSDPAQRGLYDLQHDQGSVGFLRQAAAQKRSQEGQEKSLYNWQWVNNLQETRPARAGSNIDRLRAELAAEFRDALLHAYHGPHVDMSARQLPTAFEADERTDPASPDILQLLSGRQLLGVVRERKDCLLADSETPAALGTAAAPSQQLHGSPVATEEQQSPHVSSNSTAARQQTVPSGRGKHRRQVLELLLGDGDVAATAVLQQTSDSAPIIEVFQDGDCVYREVGGRVFKPSAAPAAAAPTAEASAAGAAPAASDAAGSGGGGGGGSRRRATHRALLGRTPLVKHLDWLALRGTGGLKKELVVGRARRAWLPPSATWLFRPRNATHTTGGWYFEFPSAGSEHPAWLPPTAMVLRAAFETLEAETEATSAAQQEASAQPHSLWQRLKSQLVG